MHLRERDRHQLTAQNAHTHYTHTHTPDSTSCTSCPESRANLAARGWCASSTTGSAGSQPESAAATSITCTPNLQPHRVGATASRHKRSCAVPKCLELTGSRDECIRCVVSVLSFQTYTARDLDRNWTHDNRSASQSSTPAKQTPRPLAPRTRTALLCSTEKPSALM